MTTKQHSHYLQFLAQKYNILLLSDKSYEVYDGMKTFFNNAIQRNLQEVELENLNITLMTNNIEMVLLDATTDVSLAQKFYNAVSKNNERIVVLAIVNKKCDDGIMELISLCDNIIFDNFDKEELKGKLVEMLSVFYTILSIGRRDINLKIGSSDVDVLANFLDLYEGSSLFIVDELIELNQELKAGELSKELLAEIGKKCFEIFQKNGTSAFARRPAAYCHRYIE